MKAVKFRGVALALLLAALGSYLLPERAAAHPVDVASLSFSEVSPGRFLVHWQAGSASLQQDLSKAPAELPRPCHFDGTYVDCGRAGLVGVIDLPWLEGTLTRVMVEIEWQSHARLLRVLTASDRRLTVYGVPSSEGLRSYVPIATDYTKLGIEHILTGFDHLLFVIALMLLVRARRALLATITAFTVAHSLSLASTVFGLVTLPAPPVEAAIALSLVLICAECLRPVGSLTQRAPWLMAFVFGLLHGLGFASALLAIGLPQEHVPLALSFFNVGVELGQLGIIAAMVMLGAVVTRWRLQRPWLRSGAVYAMGALAAAWWIERLAAVIGG